MSDRVFCGQINITVVRTQHGMLSGKIVVFALYTETRYTPVQPLEMNYEQTKIA